MKSLAVISKSRPETLFLFPITSQPPPADCPAFALSEIECRRTRLRFPSWLVLDEYNATKAQNAADFDHLDPIGSLSPMTLKTVLT